MTQPDPSPALMFPSGDTVKMRRTVVHGAKLAEFVNAPDTNRSGSCCGQVFPLAAGWPAVVLVSRDGGAALPVVRDSPLAVEAILHGIRDSTGFLTIEEPEEPDWLVNDNGEAFAVEYIVPFQRRRHAWSDLAPDQPGPANRQPTPAAAPLRERLRAGE